MKRSLALFFLICALLARPTIAQSQDEDEPEANPGRPTVSTPATLTPVGYLQFESGFTGAGDSPEFSSRYSFNEVMKLSVTRRVELLASAEPVAHFTAEGSRAKRVADVFLGAQGVLYQGEGAKPTFAVSYFIASTMAELRNSISEAWPTRFWFWQARTSKDFTMTRTPSSQSWWRSRCGVLNLGNR